MIEIQAKEHDKFSVEFKVGFVINDAVKNNNFAINTWIFLPNSLDINPMTYNKESFYRDVKSNIRLITPVVLLRDIVKGAAIPRIHLEKALNDLAANPSRQNTANYEYHVKMFAAIVKSALRNEVSHIINTNIKEDFILLCNSYVENAAEILLIYRQLKQIINVPTVDAVQRNYHAFGDEFMSRLIEYYSYRLLKRIDATPFADDIVEVRSKVASLIRGEVEYKERVGLDTISPDNPAGNRSIVYRNSILKKYIESDLYIKLNKKSDGQAIKQLYYSIAAGIAMIFTTIIAFVFQQRFGNFSTPLFFALVVSYMFKDRIKELTRYYFAHRLNARYFDNKATINIKDQAVGWIKEGVDFITDEKTPKEVLELRNRSSLLEAENRIFDEKIILYRKMVFIDGEELCKNNDYHLSGVNDILRLHINSFTQKMDDPMVPLRILDDRGGIDVVFTEKIYYINIVMQFQFDKWAEYRRFRILATRNGILEVQETV